MQAELLIAALGVLATILGVLFLVLAFVEYRKLATLRENILGLREELKGDMERVQRAMQLVLASYEVEEPARKIPLLEKAVLLCPDVFNGYNALGYAYLADNQPVKALDAFTNAVNHRPQDKAGYFDLAAVYLKMYDKDLAVRSLERAVAVDPSAKDDLPGNPQFREISQELKSRRLLQ